MRTLIPLLFGFGAVGHCLLCASQRFCVRPNSGILAPGDRVEVTVILQVASKSNKSAAPASPSAAPVKSDKFLVMSGLVPPGEPGTDASAILASIPEESQGELKLRCLYDDAAAQPSGSTPTPVASRSASAPSESATSVTYSAPAASTGTISGGASSKTYEALIRERDTHREEVLRLQSQNASLRSELEAAVATGSDLKRRVAAKTPAGGTSGADEAAAGKGGKRSGGGGGFGLLFLLLVAILCFIAGLLTHDVVLRTVPALGKVKGSL